MAGQAVASDALGFCALSLTNQDSLCIRALPSSQQSCKKLRNWGLPHMLCLGDKGPWREAEPFAAGPTPGISRQCASRRPCAYCESLGPGACPTFSGHRLGVVQCPCHSACTSSSTVLTGPWQLFSPHT